MSEKLCNCDLCGGEVVGSLYKAFCQSCGQEHGLEEGIMLILSDEQLAMLRDARPRVIKRVMDDGVETKDGAA